MANVKKSLRKNASWTLEGNGFSPAENGQTETAPASPRPLSLRHNFAWALAGNVVYAATQWGMLVAIARLQSKEQLGRFALGLAITAPVFMAANLHLRAVQVTDTKNQYSLSDYIGLRLLSIVVAVLVVVAIVGCRAWQGNDEPIVPLVILLVGMCKGVESICDILHGYLQKNERMDRISWSLIAKGMIGITVFSMTLWQTNSLLAATAGLCLSWFLVFAALDIPQTIWAAGDWHRLIPSWHPASLLALAKLAFPMGIVMMLGSLSTNIPRYFVEGYYGEGELGVFSAVAYLMVAGNTVMMAVGQSIIPRLATHFAENDFRAFQRIAAKFMGIALSIGISGIAVSALFGQRLLVLIYGPGYADSASFLIWMSVVVAISYIYSVLGFGLTAMRCFRSIMWVQFVITAFLVLACAWLIPTNGLFGAGWAMLIATTIGVVAYGILWVVTQRSCLMRKCPIPLSDG